MRDDPLNTVLSGCFGSWAVLPRPRFDLLRPEAGQGLIVKVGYSTAGMPREMWWLMRQAFWGFNKPFEFRRFTICQGILDPQCLLEFTEQAGAS